LLMYLRNMIRNNKDRDGRYLIRRGARLGNYNRTGNRLSPLGRELVGYRELTEKRTALDSALEGI